MSVSYSLQGSYEKKEFQNNDSLPFGQNKNALYSYGDDLDVQGGLTHVNKSRTSINI
jgi:hypothetical protein